MEIRYLIKTWYVRASVSWNEGVHTERSFHCEQVWVYQWTQLLKECLRRGDFSNGSSLSRLRRYPKMNVSTTIAILFSRFWRTCSLHVYFFSEPECAWNAACKSATSLLIILCENKPKISIFSLIVPAHIISLDSLSVELSEDGYKRFNACDISNTSQRHVPKRK